MNCENTSENKTVMLLHYMVTAINTKLKNKNSEE